jgi:hypothetical protein
MNAETRSSARPDAWVVAAWALVASEFAIAIYLGLKRPGAGPVLVYTIAPPLLAGLALLLGAAGALWSFFHRPFGSSQRLIAFCLLGFVIASASYPLPFPSYREGRPTAVAIHLPFRGEWTVAWDGLDEDINYVQRTRPDRRFGFTFVIARDGATRADAGDARTAFAFDAEVLAPCDATVARVVGDLPDAGLAARDDVGNHVVLEIAPGEFAFLADLKQGSITVEPGEHVARGQVLARVGWSAFSPLMAEPHLALYIQDTPDLHAGQSIPFYFHDYFIGDQHVERGVPRGAGFFVGRAPLGERVHVAP